MNDKPRKTRTSSPARDAAAAAPTPAARRDWRSNPGFETRAIHAGTPPDPTTGARITPIYQTIAYVFDDVDHAGIVYYPRFFHYFHLAFEELLFTAFAELVTTYGEDAVAKFVEGLSTRIKNGEFSVRMARQ